MLKKTMMALLAVSMVASLVACGSSTTSTSSNESSEAAESVSEAEASVEETTEEDTSLAEDTSVEESQEVGEGGTFDGEMGITEERMEELVNISLPAPDNAVDVTYNAYNISSETPIAEMEFTYDGEKMFERAQMTGATQIDPDDSSTYDISGLYFDWTEKAEAEVQNRDGLACSCDEAAFVAWIDAVPGVLYNLGSTEETNPETLADIADDIFVSVQGDSN